MRSLLLLLIPGFLWAAEYPQPDANGYTSQNDEPIILSTDTCAAGRTCHTIVACDQTLDDTIGSWTALTQTNTTICLKAGNYTGLGLLALTQHGTSGTRKWLRCVQADGVTRAVHPAKTETASNWCQIERITVAGNYWILDRLYSAPSGAYSAIRTESVGALINEGRLYGWGQGSNEDLIAIRATSTGLVVQNTLIGDCARYDLLDNAAISLSPWQDGVKIVNNEIRDCTDGIIIGAGATTNTDIVLENNDWYIDDIQIGCTETSPYTFSTTEGCSCTENAIDWKSGATSAADALLVVQNRFWGYRGESTTACGRTGGNPYVININDMGDYGIFQNNIFDSNQENILFGGDPNAAAEISIIGNIFSNYQRYNSANQSYAIRRVQKDKAEIYLNFFTAGEVAANVYYWILGGDHDWMCNVAVNAQKITGTGGTQNYNVAYGDSSFDGGVNSLNYTSAAKWAAGTNYALGDVVFPTTMPGDVGFSAATHGYIMVATADSGSSGGTEPTWPTSLGSTVVDSGITWTVIRAPYTYWRKLLSTPEQSTIPYATALATSDLPEYNHCAGSGMGDRTGIGVDDTAPTWN